MFLNVFVRVCLRTIPPVLSNPSPAALRQDADEEVADGEAFEGMINARSLAASRPVLDLVHGGRRSPFLLCYDFVGLIGLALLR